MDLASKLKNLEPQLDGDIHIDKLHKIMYATDASVYKELPTGVVYPKSIEDIQNIIIFCKTHGTSIIPRSAGTSLAGQCVGKGVVLDISKYFNHIHELDLKHKKITIEPGVIRDDLNKYLKPHHLFFSPNTSSANRCTIGGMVGNNSSGTSSLKYGITSDKIIEMKVLLSDGSLITATALDNTSYYKKLELNNLEGDIYRFIHNTLSNKDLQRNINHCFPKKEIHRRNTGYALDRLANMKPFNPDGDNFNLCKLLAGSEGTLSFTLSITVKLDKLPPKNRLFVVPHFKNIFDCCHSVKSLVEEHELYQCEMMDKVILDCTKDNMLYRSYRSFVIGDPKALLMLELRDDNPQVLEQKKEALVNDLNKQNLSYAQPILYDDDVIKAEELRKAGLGLLGNIKGDKKSVACIEDTAVALSDFSDYIKKFEAILEKHHQKGVFYAHAGAGELHLRPLLNLKSKEDLRLFRDITLDVAKLVKTFRGSLSGEHGDGKVRGEFIKMMVGKNVYGLFVELKQTFDPHQIFNPRKIVHCEPMDTTLRYEAGRKEPKISSLMDFSDTMGLLRATEQCNGSGDCRKSALTGGVMCPSFQATRLEKDSTRARANVLREFLTTSTKTNPFNHIELKRVFDLCIACKACASECPSNVDAAAFKTEFLYQYKKQNGYSLRDYFFGNIDFLFKYASKMPMLSNLFIENKATHQLLKRMLGVSSKRNFPSLSPVSIKKMNAISKKNNNRNVILCIDELTRYTDSAIVYDAYHLLEKLGYNVIPKFYSSGRSQLSIGFLTKAKLLAQKNVLKFKSHLNTQTPILGIEPSAILSFRDEYLRLYNKEETKKLSKNTFLIEEFLAKEIRNKNISSNQFHHLRKSIKIHVHCHQKSLSNQQCTMDILNFPKYYKAEIIDSGCCGMAGSFGYHKEHYDISCKIGNLKLIPKIKDLSEDIIIASNGVSCRQQIQDLGHKKALHPISILNAALLN